MVVLIELREKIMNREEMIQEVRDLQLDMGTDHPMGFYIAVRINELLKILNPKPPVQFEMDLQPVIEYPTFEELFGTE